MSALLMLDLFPGLSFVVGAVWRTRLRLGS